MITVECKECAIRNFCSKQELAPNTVEVAFDLCPLMQLINPDLKEISVGITSLEKAKQMAIKGTSNSIIDTNMT